MYLMITSRCNFRCGHCCFACTSKGTDMPLHVFERALNLFGTEVLSIGGGEPTLHPEFRALVTMALDYCQQNRDGEGPFIVTNGSRTRHALWLAKLSREGLLHAELSRTRWHLEQRPISDKVIETYATLYPPLPWHLYPVGHRTVLNPIQAGRWKEGERRDCCCEDVFIDPEGRVWRCGCRVEQYGTVFDSQVPEYGEGGCSRERKDTSSVLDDQLEGFYKEA